MGDDFHYMDCGINGGWPHPASAHDPKNPSTIISDETKSIEVNTVIIGGFSSKCGACGGNAFPDEGAHITEVHDGIEIFYENKLTGDETILPAEKGVQGCGVKWYYMTSDYIGDKIKETCVGKWPQYEWIDYQ